MADIPQSLRSWSATAASNSPSGGTVIGSGLDDNLRALQATVRQYLASQGSAMTAASTVDLSTADGYYITINGSTTITSFGTEQAGISYLLKFASTPVITHNGTSLILPGGANITAAAGDLMLVVSEGSGNWRCEMYQPATSTPVEKLPTTKGDIVAATAAQTFARLGVGTDGQVLTAEASATAGVKWATPTSGPTNGTAAASTSGTAVNYTLSGTVKRVTFMLSGVSTNGTNNLILRIGPSGGVVSTGYLGSQSVVGGSSANFTTSFLIRLVAAASVTHGSITLTLLDSATNTWTAQWCIGGSDAAQNYIGAGSIALSGALNKLSLTTEGGTDAFDAGLVNILYE